ncbi:hypothetical protein ABIE67_009234 [Streptomyces sp. V4I8]
MDVIRFGLHRALRTMRQDFRRATPRSTGARAAESARLTVRWVSDKSPPGGRLTGVLTHGPAPRQARSASTGTPRRSQVRMIRWVRAAVKSWARPGSAGDSHSSRAAGSFTTCTFHPVPAALVSVVGPAVADPAAFREAAIEQDEVGVGLAQNAQQAGCAVGEQADDGCRARVGGAPRRCRNRPRSA